MNEKFDITTQPLIAVIDTETNWYDQVMSIGLVVAKSSDFQPISCKYYIIDPEYRVGGMYSGSLFSVQNCPQICCLRKDAIFDISAILEECNIHSIFAYNACFDRSHLPELSAYFWGDIMKFAAYRQTNKKLPAFLEFCSTGRLKKDYGVEPMLRILSGKTSYFEQHNAVTDACDELKIMELLGIPFEEYTKTSIG